MRNARAVAVCAVLFAVWLYGQMVPGRNYLVTLWDGTKWQYPKMGQSLIVTSDNKLEVHGQPCNGPSTGQTTLQMQLPDQSCLPLVVSSQGGTQPAVLVDTWTTNTNIGTWVAGVVMPGTPPAALGAQCDPAKPMAQLPDGSCLALVGPVVSRGAVKTGSSAPDPDTCTAESVGTVFARIDPFPFPLYVCGQSAAGSYAWVNLTSATLAAIAQIDRWTSPSGIGRLRMKLWDNTTIGPWQLVPESLEASMYQGWIPTSAIDK